MSIKKNFTYNLLYQLLLIIIPLITTPYIARIIGAEGVGIQSYTYSIVRYFVLFAMLGINNHGNRSIAMARDDKEELSKTFISIYSIQAIISIIMIIIYSIYIIFFVNEYKIIFIIQIIYLIGTFFDINWFFFGMEEFKLTVVRNTIIKIITLMSIFVFVKESNDLYIYSLILAMETLISQLVLWRFLFKKIIFVKVSFAEIKSNIKPIIILFIPVIAISIYKIMDKIMLGSMSSVVQVGFYENSEKIIAVPMGIITALGTVMLPKMSNLISSGKMEEAKKYVGISLKFAMFISIGAMFGIIGVASNFIPLFLGNKFIECISVVSILSGTIMFIAWANVIRTQILIPRKMDKIYIVSTFLGAVVNMIINILLIPKFGANGAAIATIFAEATVCIYQTIMVRREINILVYLKSNMIFIISAIIMLVLIKWIDVIAINKILTGFIQIIVGGSVYILISFSYMIIIREPYVIGIVKKIKMKLERKIIKG